MKFLIMGIFSAGLLFKYCTLCAEGRVSAGEKLHHCSAASAGTCSAQMVPCWSRGISAFPPSGITYGNYGGVLANIWKDRHGDGIACFSVREQKVLLVFEEVPSVMGLLIGGLIQKTGERKRHMVTFIISFSYRGFSPN